MNIQTAFIPMSDKHELFTVHWSSDTPNPKGIIILFHGMAEHILRYSPFATFLTKQGYEVYGHDQRGHGKTAKRNGVYGFFAEVGGFDRVVQDGYERMKSIKEIHPGVPVTIFGHSMGSFIVRRLMELYSKEMDAVILSGTGGNPKWLGDVGRIIAKREIKRKGKQTPSPLLNQLSFGSFNKKFRPNRTDFDWLSSDNKQVDVYMDDDMCGGICTTQFYYDLFTGIKQLYKRKEIQKIRPDLPILFVSGAEDPVGNFGKGVQEAVDSYVQNGINHVTVKLYERARHELLQESNKEQVYIDIVAWLEKNNRCE